MLVVAQPAAAKIICRRTASLGRSLLPGLQGDPGGILRRDAGPGDGGVVACLLAPQQLMMMRGDSRSVMPCAHTPVAAVAAGATVSVRCPRRTGGIRMVLFLCFFVCFSIGARENLYGTATRRSRIPRIQIRAGGTCPVPTPP